MSKAGEHKPAPLKVKAGDPQTEGTKARANHKISRKNYKDLTQDSYNHEGHRPSSLF
jgi:hypothetical protein